MAALKRYTVTVQNRRNKVETIMKLTPEDAKRLGGVEYTKGKAPENKSRTASNKGGRGGSRRAASKPAAKPVEKPAETSTESKPSGDGSGSTSAAE